MKRSVKQAVFLLEVVSVSRDRKGTKATIEADASTVGHSRIRGLLEEQNAQQPSRSWPRFFCLARRWAVKLARSKWPGTCTPPLMGIGKAVVAGVGAKMLTGSLIGFIVVFALIYWLL